MSDKIVFEREAVESGANYAAAEVLLIGLKHIKEHRISHPIGTSDKEWFDDIVPELIWFCEVMTKHAGVTKTPVDQERFKKAKRLLGEHFTDIWC